jgi:ribbon-helix-helix CopG family protein
MAKQRKTTNPSNVTSVILDPELLRALKAEARRREDSVGKLLRQAAREWLQKHAGEKGGAR